MDSEDPLATGGETTGGVSEPPNILSDPMTTQPIIDVDNLPTSGGGQSVSEKDANGKKRSNEERRSSENIVLNNENVADSIIAARQGAELHVRKTTDVHDKSLNRPRNPTAHSKKYLTANYLRYDANKHFDIDSPDQTGRELPLSAWVGYPLFTEAFSKTSLVPKGCRLDDRTLAALVESDETTSHLSTTWSTEIDSRRMIKARRMPLGFAAKMYVNEGNRDRNGQPCTSAGWYYKWYHGLHLLCGLEGQESYLHRPQHEHKLTNTWYFDMAFPCKFQEPEGGPRAQANLDATIGTAAEKVKLTPQDKHRNRPSISDNYEGIKNTSRDLDHKYTDADLTGDTDQESKGKDKKGIKATDTNMKVKRNVDDKGETGSKKKTKVGNESEIEKQKKIKVN